MIVTTVHVYVKPGNIDDFINATSKNHSASIEERGNLRFDILQDANDSTKFLLYEAYESEVYSAAHKETSHYLEWREKVSPWMEKPREGIKYNILFPK